MTWCASSLLLKKKGNGIHPNSQGQPLVHLLHGKCVELTGMAVEDTGVTNWG